MIILHVIYIIIKKIYNFCIKELIKLNSFNKYKLKVLELNKKIIIYESLKLIY